MRLVQETLGVFRTIPQHMFRFRICRVQMIESIKASQMLSPDKQTVNEMIIYITNRVEDHRRPILTDVINIRIINSFGTSNLWLIE